VQVQEQLVKKQRTRLPAKINMFGSHWHCPIWKFRVFINLSKFSMGLNYNFVNRLYRIVRCVVWTHLQSLNMKLKYFLMQLLKDTVYSSTAVVTYSRIRVGTKFSIMMRRDEYIVPRERPAY
jgi:hypothetical protein